MSCPMRGTYVVGRRTNVRMNEGSVCMYRNEMPEKNQEIKTTHSSHLTDPQSASPRREPDYQEKLSSM